MRTLDWPVDYPHFAVQSGMIARTIRERLQRDPFEPFFSCSSSGQAVRVVRPELAVLMKTQIFLAAPNSDQWTQLPCLHIAGIESDRNGNGRRPGRKRR